MVTCDDQKQELLELLNETSSQLLQIADGFDETQINKIPFEDSWTAAQVLDHVTKSNASIIKALNLKGTTINRDPGERVGELRDVFLDFGTKLKSPGFILPAQDIYEKGVVVGRLKDTLDALKNIQQHIDLSEMINHPAFGDITKFEILHFVLFHTQRHSHQLKKIFTAIAGRD